MSGKSQTGIQQINPSNSAWGVIDCPWPEVMRDDAHAVPTLPINNNNMAEVERRLTPCHFIQVSYCIGIELQHAVLEITTIISIFLI